MRLTPAAASVSTNSSATVLGGIARPGIRGVRHARPKGRWHESQFSLWNTASVGALLLLALASNHYLTGGGIDRGIVWPTHWFRWLDQARALSLLWTVLLLPAQKIPYPTW